MEGRVFEFFPKNQKCFKNPKMPKIVPISVQTKFSKSKKISKFQKSPKSFQKVSQRVLNKFRGDFFGKKICPVFHGGSSFRIFSKKSKKFQNSKKAQNRSQKCPNVFWTSLGLIFSKKNFCPVFDGGSSLRKFSKKSKKFKVPKMPKIVPKSFQTKIFKKNQKSFKIPKTSKIVPKVSKRVLNMFWGNFFEKIFCPVFQRGSSHWKFSKKFFKIPKMPKIVPKSVQTCFEDVLGSQCSMEGRVFEFFQKNQKIFKIQKKIPSQKCPNVFWRCFRVIFRKIF